MSVGLTKDVVIAYIAEAAYAGGNAGIKYAKTVSTTAANFTAMNFPKGEQQMPYKEYEREKIRAPGQLVDSVQTFVKAYKYKDATMKVYPQSAIWLDDIISGTAGSIPTSYYFKYTQPTMSFDVFGCVLTKYEITAKAGDFCEESLDWSVYEIDEGAAIGTGKAFLTTQPLIFKDIDLTIGGTPIANLDSLTLTIERELLDAMAGGKYQRLDPVFVKRSMTLKATFYDSSDALITDTRDAATNLVTLIVDLDSVSTSTSKTLTATNMVLEEVNTNFIPEFGLYKYEVTYVNGGATGLTTA